MAYVFSIVFLCMHTNACVCVCVCTREHACGGQKSSSGIVPQESSIFYFKIYFIFNYNCGGVYACVSPDAYRVQKSMLDPPELELQAIVSCLTWVPGAELEYILVTADLSLRPQFLSACF